MVFLWAYLQIEWEFGYQNMILKSAGISRYTKIASYQFLEKDNDFLDTSMTNSSYDKIDCKTYYN